MWKSRLASGVTISVLRHGESENNLLDIDCADIAHKNLYGLTAHGIEQIESAAAEQKELNIILHSPLRRAVESAHILSTRWSTPSRCEELLIEVNSGIFENRPAAERLEWKRKNRSRSYPSGESKIEVENRVRTLLTKLSTEFQGQRVLLVTHGTLLFHLFGAVFDEIDWSEYNAAYRNGRRVSDLRTYDRLSK